MNHRTARSASLLVALSLSVGVAGCSRDAPAAGSWAGWVYGDGDFPIRLHVEPASSGELAATVDYPHAEIWRSELESFRADGERNRLRAPKLLGQVVGLRR